MMLEKTGETEQVKGGDEMASGFDQGPRRLHAHWHTLDQMLQDYRKRREISESVQKPELFAMCAVDNMVSRYARPSYLHTDVFVDGQNDNGIDGIGIVVNGDVVTSIEQIDQSIEEHRDLNVKFVFVQATMEREFRQSKMGNFAQGVWTFFHREETGPRSERLEAAIKLKDAIFDRAQRMRSGRPEVYMHYISIGQWVDDPVLKGALVNGAALVEEKDLFKSVVYDILDLRGFLDQRRVYQIRSSGEVHSYMLQRLPRIEEADNAFIGAILVSDLLNLVTYPDTERLNRNVFIENVRGYQGQDNQVNASINETLSGEQAAMFTLLNNGITIVCRDCQAFGPTLELIDYQIVNGCQTTCVIFHNRDNLKDQDILVPVKIVVTGNEHLVESIISSTNNQTVVTDDHILSLSSFNRRLAEYYRAMLISGQSEKLYYDLREGEYLNNPNLQKERVITIKDQLQSFSSMFLGRPHDAVEQLKLIREEVNTRIFHPAHVPETYYTASLAAFKFDQLSQERLIDPVFRNYRFQILHVLRKKLFPPQFNLSNWNVAPILCREVNEKFLDHETAVQIFGEACEIIRTAARLLEVPELPREAASRKAFTETVNEVLAAANSVEDSGAE